MRTYECGRSAGLHPCPAPASIRDRFIEPYLEALFWQQLRAPKRASSSPRFARLRETVERRERELVSCRDNPRLPRATWLGALRASPPGAASSGQRYDAKPTPAPGELCPALHPSDPRASAAAPLLAVTHNDSKRPLDGRLVRIVVSTVRRVVASTLHAGSTSSRPGSIPLALSPRPLALSGRISAAERAAAAASGRTQVGIPGRSAGSPRRCSAPPDGSERGPLAGAPCWGRLVNPTKGSTRKGWRTTPAEGLPSSST